MSGWLYFFEGVTKKVTCDLRKTWRNWKVNDEDIWGESVSGRGTSKCSPNTGFEVCLVSWSLQGSLGNRWEGALSPVWYFYEAFIFPAKNILCLSEGWGGRWWGGKWNGKIISASCLQICSVDWSFYLLWVWALAFHAHVWMSSLTYSSPGPSCFNERKAVQSHPLILDTPFGWPGQFPFQ